MVGNIPINLVLQQHVRRAVKRNLSLYLKVPKFWDAGSHCCNLPKIYTTRPNLRVVCPKNANGIANSEGPDQTAPLGAV